MGIMDDGGNEDIIAKTRAAFENKVPEQQQNALQRVVLAGQKILYDKQTNGFVEKELSKGDPATAAGQGAVKLIAILQQESRGTMPKAVQTPAMMVLMTEILDYLKQTKRIEGTAADVDTAAKAMTEMMTKGVHANLDQILDKTTQAMNDPKIAAAVQQHMQGA